MYGVVSSVVMACHQVPAQSKHQLNFQHNLTKCIWCIYRISCRLRSSTEHNRAEVARGSIGAVVHVAKLMADDPVLVCAVSAAVYNFVSRQGAWTVLLLLRRRLRRPQTHRNPPPHPTRKRSQYTDPLLILMLRQKPILSPSSLFRPLVCLLKLEQSSVGTPLIIIMCCYSVVRICFASVFHY